MTNNGQRFDFEGRGTIVAEAEEKLGDKGRANGVRRGESDERETHRNEASVHQTRKIDVRRCESWGIERWGMRKVLAANGWPRIAIELWDGTEIMPPGRLGEELTGRVRINSRGALLRLLAHPEYQFGAQYCAGGITVEGDLADVIAEVTRGEGKRVESPWYARLWDRLVKRGSSLSESRENIHRHYDLGNDFYQMWLDKEMLYTCAYYEKRGMTLEEAQRAKMEHVCRKLELRSGERVIEAGCGWGGLALYMAKEYGVKVRAFNISKEQVRYARKEAERRGLSEMVEFVEGDWREISGECDAFVSVGMLEHVGVKNYGLLGQVMRRVLVRDGRGLIHTIGRNYPKYMNPWTERHIFPGAYPPSLREMMQIFEGENFSILDVENLRLHYRETLLDWRSRFERNESRVREMFDEKFVKAWRLYLCASIAAFEVGDLQLFQVVFAGGNTGHVWRTRRHVYLGEPGDYFDYESTTDREAKLGGGQFYRTNGVTTDSGRE